MHSWRFDLELTRCYLSAHSFTYTFPTPSPTPALTSAATTAATATPAWTPSPTPLKWLPGAYLSGKTAPFPPDSGKGPDWLHSSGPVLPSQKLDCNRKQCQPSDCYYDTDDCEGADASTWQTIWKVTYPDNPSTSVTLCVCSTASFTPNELAHYVGKVPVFLRTTVSAYNAVSGGGTAYTIGGTVTLQGDCVMDVFVHESTHAFDGTYSLSGTSAYLEALYEDSCVPDEYAMTNNVECFAQDMVVFVYYLWDPNFLQNVCMEYEIFYINQLTVPGVQAYTAMVGLVGAVLPTTGVSEPQTGTGSAFPISGQAAPSHLVDRQCSLNEWTGSFLSTSGQAGPCQLEDRQCSLV
ncbi:MAG: hypothetical protein FRX49_06822 [Trebouxia sp. A1-2]|nr:MAG: hypothetical protein FRX49_06822 [Trebouxia sp. A1-2]